MVWDRIPALSISQTNEISISVRFALWTQLQQKRIGFWSDVLAFGQAYWLFSNGMAADWTGRHENGSGNTRRVFPHDASNSGGHLRARKPANQDATRTSSAPDEMYRLFFEGLSRDDTHFHQLAQKYKK